MYVESKMNFYIFYFQTQCYIGNTQKKVFFFCGRVANKAGRGEVKPPERLLEQQIKITKERMDEKNMNH